MKESFPIKRNELWYSQKISELRSSLGLSQAAFAKRLGVSGAAIGQLERGESKSPSADLLGALASMLSVNLDWLLNGEGEMLKSDTAPKNNFVLSADFDRAHGVAEEAPAPYGTPGLRVLTVQVGADEEENIELVGARAAAGYAQGGFHQPDFIERLPSFRLPDPAYRNATFRCFQVIGDSMQPTLHPGDWVICRYVARWDRDVRDNRVYVVVLPETVVVKRLLNRINSRGELSLLSDNPAYSVQFTDPADVREVWEAVGKLSRQFINPRYDVSTELARQSATMEELLQRVERLESGNKSTKRTKE